MIKTETLGPWTANGQYETRSDPSGREWLRRALDAVPTAALIDGAWKMFADEATALAALRGEHGRERWGTDRPVTEGPDFRNVLYNIVAVATGRSAVRRIATHVDRDEAVALITEHNALVDRAAELEAALDREKAAHTATSRSLGEALDNPVFED